MNSVNDVLHTMNKMMFKHNLTKKELQDFKTIRKFLISEFNNWGLTKSNLLKLLNIVDELHVDFLHIHPQGKHELINNFNEFFFKLYKQKLKIYAHDNYEFNILIKMTPTMITTHK